ncbi:MAG: trypsin-like peptidase domain-containing protein [Gemmatimonadetes bacterium]|nr:trypsin-like peptidase domain-containing protein [Gemmatimonadota bacterium]
MFAHVCATIRDSVYGLAAGSQVSPGQINWSLGTGFMVAPGIVATVAHLAHVGNDPTMPLHQFFNAIRAPDIGCSLEVASLLAEDPVRDVALLRMATPRSEQSIALRSDIVPSGTNCGSLGFPLGTINGTRLNLIERFQGASISAYHTQLHPCSRQLSFYETDALMYSGASGCPGFDVDGLIWGMHVGSNLDPNATATSQGGQADRLAISLWVPSVDIAAFIQGNGIALGGRA